jgi:neutral ceramidase
MYWGETKSMWSRSLCREALRIKLIAEGVLDDRAYVVVAGPGNTYGHYVATREEYSVQRYEGASTLFGPGEFGFGPQTSLLGMMFSDALLPATLEAYINRYSELVPYLADNVTGSPLSGVAPLEQTSKAISMQVSLSLHSACRALRVISSLIEPGHRRLPPHFQKIWRRPHRCRESYILRW